MSAEPYRMHVYDDAADAELVVQMLFDMGYSKHEIDIVMADTTRQRDFVERASPDGFTTGAVVGGSIGAIVAGFTATGTLAAIIATGRAAPFLAGPIVALLAGLGVGGSLGGVVGALVKLGVPEERAKGYEERLDDGAILVGVTPREEHIDRLRVIFPDETAT